MPNTGPGLRTRYYIIPKRFPSGGWNLGLSASVQLITRVQAVGGDATLQLESCLEWNHGPRCVETNGIAAGCQVVREVVC